MDIRFVDPRKRTQRRAAPEMYKEFDATELYCPKCRRSMPVRKRLLLVLPEGDKYEYLCKYCATSVGTKIVREKEQTRIIT
jgi:hypothetical protein